MCQNGEAAEEEPGPQGAKQRQTRRMKVTHFCPLPSNRLAGWCFLTAWVCCPLELPTARNLICGRFAYLSLHLASMKCLAEMPD